MERHGKDITITVLNTTVFVHMYYVFKEKLQEYFNN